MKQFAEHLTRQLEELNEVAEVLRASATTRELAARLDQIELAIVDAFIEMEGRTHRERAEAIAQRAERLRKKALPVKRQQPLRASQAQIPLAT